jgi:hypothetical protein
VLTLTTEQHAALVAGPRARFCARALAHVRACAPELYAREKQAGVRALIEHALAKARDYDLHGEHDVVLYLNAMLVLGRDFDDDVAWARDILDDPHRERRMARIDEALVAAAAGRPET